MGGRIPFERDQRAAIDAALDAAARPAIVLHRAPRDCASGLSRLGGLPTLPDDVAWPMGSVINFDTGDWHQTPLHFLGQIDCGEAHGLDRRLPETGLLLFFASLHGEIDWIDSEKPEACYWRVLYCPGVPADQLGRAPPADLEPMQEHYAAYSGVMPGEANPRISPAASVVLYPVTSYPQMLGIAALEALSDTLDRGPATWAEEAAMAERFAQRSRWKSAAAYFIAIEAIPGFARDAFEPDACGLRFEEWHYQCFGGLRHLLRGIIGEVGTDAASLAQLRERQAAIADRPDRECLSQDAFDEVRRWLAALRAGAQNPRAVGRGVEVGARTAARQGQFPPPPFEPDTPDTFPNPPPVPRISYAPQQGQSARVDAPYHQMFGHFPSSQEPQKIDDPHVGLLHLMSDRELEWMFGDAGELQFWISPDDLAARRFDRAWATVQGS